jgi:hypothetical protein
LFTLKTLPPKCLRYCITAKLVPNNIPEVHSIKAHIFNVLHFIKGGLTVGLYNLVSTKGGYLLTFCHADKKVILDFSNYLKVINVSEWTGMYPISPSSETQNGLT